MDRFRFTETDERSKLAALKWKAKQADAKVHSAKTGLYLLIGLTALSMVFEFLVTKNILSIIVGVFLIGVYWFCTLFIKSYPQRSLVVALTVFLIANFLPALFDPSLLFRGILWKVLFTSIFIIGIINVTKAKQLRKEYESKLRILDEQESS